MKVNVFNQQKLLPVTLTQIKKIVRQVIRFEKKELILHNHLEVSIYLIENEAMISLHKKYFNDPTPTDCISFPIDEESLLGDVFVCPEVALTYSRKHHLDVYEELTLYIVHGLLHLMGYDDIEPKDRALMRKAERKHMLELKKCILQF